MTGSSWARNVQNSVMPPSWRNDSVTGSSPRRSVSVSCEPGDDERGLPRPGDQLVPGELRVAGEDLAVGPEPDPGAGDALLDPAALVQPRLLLERRPTAPSPANTPGKPRWKDIAWVAGDRSTSTSRRDGERVDDRGADAVQAAGRGVRTAAELPAGVQLGVDDLDAGEPRLRLLVDRDAAAVVVDLRGAVGVQDHVDLAAVTRQRLVDRVVDDLPQAVHQSAGVGGPDVHARPLADGLEPLENEQVLGVVGVVDGSDLWHDGWCVAGTGLAPNLPTRAHHQSATRHVTNHP